MVSAAFQTPPQCDRPTASADSLAAAYWLIGTQPVANGEADPADVTEAVARWEALRAAPAAEAQAHVVALRTAALTCTADSNILHRSAR